MSNPPRDDRPVDSAIQPCPNRFWFDVRLLPRREASPRPAWWPVDRLPGYGGSHVSVILAGVAPPLQTLDGNGRFHADGLPAGRGTVVFYEFCADIGRALEAGAVFHPR